MMIRRALAAFTTAVFTLLASPAPAQPVQWNYSFVNGVATATYPGNVQINGTCTAGCSGVIYPSQPNTWLGTQTFQGAPTTLGAIFPNIGEVTTVTASAPPATTNYDVLTQSVQFYTTAATANWTVNIRGNSSTTLNSVMSIGQSVTVALVTTQGASPFFASAVQIDGVSVTPKWQGGAPAAGNASGLDVYTFTVIKTAVSTYTVLASQVQFK